MGRMKSLGAVSWLKPSSLGMPPGRWVGIRTLHGSLVNMKSPGQLRNPKKKPWPIDDAYKQYMIKMTKPFAPPIGWSFKNEAEMKTAHLATQEELAARVEERLHDSYRGLMGGEYATLDVDERVISIQEQQGAEEEFHLPTKEEINQHTHPREKVESIGKVQLDFGYTDRKWQEEIDEKRAAREAAQRERARVKEEERERKENSDRWSSSRTLNRESLDLKLDMGLSTDIVETVAHAVWRRKLELAETSELVTTFFERRHRNSAAYLELILMLRSYGRGKDALMVLRSMLSDDIVISPLHLCHAVATAAEAGCTEDITAMDGLYYGRRDIKVDRSIDDTGLTIIGWLAKCRAESMAVNGDVDGLISLMLAMRARSLNTIAVESLLPRQRTGISKLNPSDVNLSTVELPATSAYQSSLVDTPYETMREEISPDVASKLLAGRSHIPELPKLDETNTVQVLGNGRELESGFTQETGITKAAGIFETADELYAPERPKPMEGLPLAVQVQRPLANVFDHDTFGKSNYFSFFRGEGDQPTASIPWNQLANDKHLWSSLIIAFSKKADHVGANLAYYWFKRKNPGQGLTMRAYEELLAVDNRHRKDQDLNVGGLWLTLWKEAAEARVKPTPGFISQVFQFCTKGEIDEIFGWLERLEYPLGPRLLRWKISSLRKDRKMEHQTLLVESERVFAEVVESSGGIGYIGMEIPGELMMNIAIAQQRRIQEKARELRELHYLKVPTNDTLDEEDDEDEDDPASNTSETADSATEKKAEERSALTELDLANNLVALVAKESPVLMEYASLMQHGYISVLLYANETGKAKQIFDDYYQPEGKLLLDARIFGVWAKFLDMYPDVISVESGYEIFKRFADIGVAGTESHVVAFARYFALNRDYDKTEEGTDLLRYVKHRNYSNRVKQTLISLSKLVDNPASFIRKLQALGYEFDKSLRVTRKYDYRTKREIRQPLDLQNINWWRAAKLGPNQYFTKVRKFR